MYFDDIDKEIKKTQEQIDKLTQEFDGLQKIVNTYKQKKEKSK